MKIKTITCHEVYNHGASLQEHALLTYLESLGHDCETIHYKPAYLSNHFKLLKVYNPKYKNFFIKGIYLLLKLPGRLKDLKRKKAFDDFSEKHIKTGAKLYKTNEDLKEDLPEADAFICGSDQIWNSLFENGKDPAFYLDFVPENQLKISYAASFAIDEIAPTLISFVKEKVARIQHVSVRETSGVRLLGDLGITEVSQVLDPVFLLPQDYWKENFVTSIAGDYIFIYDFDNNEFVKRSAQKLAKKRGLKIFTVNKNIKYADKNYWLHGPEVYLSLMYHAQFVITNSFHSVAFSLIFQKQFIVVNRSENINTRMRDLLSLFNLSHLLISNDNKNMVFPFIDHDILHNPLGLAISKSKDFLKTSLKKT